jgi:short-subunit dehydrogenase
MKNTAYSIVSRSREVPETALITGATCGIGKAFAECFAGLGYNLILTGRRENILQGVAGDIRLRYKVKVQVLTAELSRDEDVEEVITMMSGAESLSILVNNAGFGSGAAFSRSSLSDHMKMLKVHVVAPMKLIHAVLPSMVSRGRGIIINVSSMGALTPAPGNTLYCSTKIFLKSFTECLHLEVKQHGIHMLCVCPGFTHTEFHHRRVAGDSTRKNGVLRWMEADEVVLKSLNALENGRVIYIPGFWNRLVVSLTKLIPKDLYYILMSHLMNGKGSTEECESENHPYRVITL